MRRKNFEVKTQKELINIIDECETVRIAINDDGYPYNVPLSFGYEIIDEKIILYIHGAVIGKRYELLKKDGRIGIEMDKFFQYKASGTNITCNYESIIAKGETIELTRKEDKKHALMKVLEHCGYVNYPIEWDNPYLIEKTGVFKIELFEISGKKKHEKFTY